MTKPSSAFLGIVIILAFVLLAVYGILSWPDKPAGEIQGRPNGTAETLTLPKADFGNPSLGLNDAPLIIFIYSDYQCGACSSIEPNLIDAVTSYPDKIRLVWKDLPNERLHPNATDAAIAARCADQQGGFWSFHDQLMANQTSLDENNFQGFAEEAGLSTEDFFDCYTNRTTEPLVRRDIEEAVGLGIDATPYLFVGRVRLSGAVSSDRLKLTIESELKRLGQL